MKLVCATIKALVNGAAGNQTYVTKRPKSSAPKKSRRRPAQFKAGSGRGRRTFKGKKTQPTRFARTIKTLKAIRVRHVMMMVTSLSSLLVVASLLFLVLDTKNSPPPRVRPDTPHIFEEEGYPDDVQAVLEGMRGRQIIDFGQIEENVPRKGRPQKASSWQTHAVAYTPPDGPLLAIVIDDMGMVLDADRRLSDLPQPLTLAYLPYSPNLRAQTERARKAGHELMVHLPMEPTSRSADPGPNALLLSLDLAEFDRRLNNNLGAFEGFVGVNNHMGSKMTTDPSRMVRVMAALKRSGVLFVDSLTSPNTVGPQAARAADVPFMTRDIFLDNDKSKTLIKRQLRKAVEAARREGMAIAIGHPYHETLDVLISEVPKFEAEGVALAPISALMARKLANEAKGQGQANALLTRSE